MNERLNLAAQWDSVGRYNNMTNAVHINCPDGQIQVRTDRAIQDAELIIKAIKFYAENQTPERQ